MMLRLAFLFFGVAIIAGIFGFGNIADEAAAVSQFFFLLFALLCAATLTLKIVVGENPNDYL